MKFHTLKKAFAFVLILTMVFSSSLTVFAAETSTQMKVQLNGEMIDFTDAAPKMVDSRVMIPFRAILEKLDATVEYDEEKETVTAKLGDKNISFAVGNTDLKVTTGEQTESKKMDVAPFVDQKNNRTYVSTRSIAEAFGYSVGWDNANKAVIIIDFDKIFKNANKDFSYLSMPYTVEYDTEKTYKTTGTLDGNVKIAPPLDVKQTMNVGFSGKLTSLQQRMNADMTMNMALDMDALFKSQDMTEEEKAALTPLKDALKNIEMQIKMSDSGIMYIKCPMLSNIMGSLGQKIDADTWYKLDMNAMYEEMGMDFQDIMNMSKGFSGNMNLSELLTKFISGTSAIFTVDTYKDVNTMYALAKELAGDAAFKTVGNTHTLTIDKNALKAVLDKKSGLSKEGLKELQEADFSCTIQLNELDGKIKDTKVKFSIDSKDISMSMDVSGDALSSVCNVVMSIPDLMEMTMDMKAESKVSTEKVDTTIPKGANVVDYMKTMESLN